MTTGIIAGGWEYVRAAYALSWIVLGSYGLSLLIRYRRLGRDKG